VSDIKSLEIYDEPACNHALQRFENRINSEEFDKQLKSYLEKKENLGADEIEASFDKHKAEIYYKFSELVNLLGKYKSLSKIDLQLENILKADKVREKPQLAARLKDFFHGKHSFFTESSGAESSEQAVVRSKKGAKRRSKKKGPKI